MSAVNVAKIKASWDPSTKSTDITGSDEDLFSLDASKWTKIYVEFLNGDNSTYKRAFEVKKVKTQKGAESFFIRENSWFKRKIPDAWFKSHYRVALDKVLPVKDCMKRQTSTVTKSIPLKLLKGNPKGGVGIGEKLSGDKPKLQVVCFADSQAGSLNLTMESTDTPECIKAPMQIERPGHQPFMLNGVSSLSSVKAVAKTAQPVFVFDVDDTLVSEKLKEKNSRIAMLSQDRFFETEKNISRYLLDLKKSYPESKIVLLTNGFITEQKLKAIGVDREQRENLVILENNKPKSKEEEQALKKITKGERLSAYFNKYNIPHDEIIFIDDTMSCHQEIADTFYDKTVRHLFYVGATHNKEKVACNAGFCNESKLVFEDYEDITLAHNLLEQMQRFSEEVRREFIQEQREAFKKQMRQG
ncbi:hypothetical protein SOPP22_02815 [Shewanella sp. OPT22]|nr:hypothetical protein SOPP22_02815 [Shewanella sp. OPT22]